MWSRSGEGGAIALGADDSELSMMPVGLGEADPLSPMRRRARSGWLAWWKVERGLDSLPAVS
jgi:hypothetical protein